MRLDVYLISFKKLMIDECGLSLEVLRLIRVLVLLELMKHGVLRRLNAFQV